MGFGCTPSGGESRRGPLHMSCAMRRGGLQGGAKYAQTPRAPSQRPKSSRDARLLRTNRTPPRAAQSSMRGPATLLGRFFGQQWLDHFPQSVCNEFLSHAFVLPTVRFR